MPVPNARILNPFVPRDDLGIEEDISNKLYLPSDVSLSLATMVGRNGRKPRIVQMDDDGKILVSSSSLPRKSNRQVFNHLNNTFINPGDNTNLGDLSSFSRVRIVFLTLYDISNNVIWTFTIHNTCSGMNIDEDIIVDTNTSTSKRYVINLGEDSNHPIIGDNISIGFIGDGTIPALNVFLSVVAE